MNRQEANPMRQVDVHKLADEARFNPFHGLVLLWCALIIVFDGFHIKVVLAAMYALAAISITLLGCRMPAELLFIVVAVAGASTIGTQIVANAYAGRFYPMAIRSTGLGWALGIGRSGAILAPIVIGMLVGMNLPLQQNFIAIAIPAVIGMVAVLMINHERSASAHRQDVSAGIPDSPASASVAGRI
jgi:AAHS family benzoate transporter-like MFS transporter